MGISDVHVVLLRAHTDGILELMGNLSPDLIYIYIYVCVDALVYGVLSEHSEPLRIALGPTL